MKKLALPKNNDSLFVHLGNIGQSRPEKTIRLASRFSEKRAHFVGIDRKQFDTSEFKNWTQIKAGFLAGLNKLRNGSARAISSEMAVGFPNKQKFKSYNGKILHSTFRKLSRGGKLFIVATEEIIESLLLSLKKAGFPSEGINARPMRPIEYKRTPWTRHCKINSIPLIQVIAEKPK